MSGTLPGYKTGPIDWRATLLGTRAPGWSILVRLVVGLVVFLPEGTQKLAFPDILGAGRFANIGIPYPELMGPFVGIVEIICGTLVILGLLTRLAAVPLIIIMIVAIVSPKVTRGFRHAAGCALPPDRGCRRMVAGCDARPRWQAFKSIGGLTP
jgi:uncharacterized membrane protein YphA (DoxX/SURF4 family)